MASLFKRIKSRVVMTATNIKQDCRFSSKLATYRLIDDLAWRMGAKRLSEKYHEKKAAWIMTFLQKELQGTVETFQNDTDIGQARENAPIWVCWWTGIDSAPELVKRCVASIYQRAGNHPVHLITHKNYKEFLEIPQYMLEKAQDGRMCFAHLADYIRVKLLAEHGGLWLDATIFCSQNIPEKCFELPFFTMKGPVQKSRYLSNLRWVTFCLGGWKGNIAYRFLAEAFETYWLYNDYAVDYLFFDSVILLAYEQNPPIRELLDNVPDNNLHRDDLQAAMNAALPATAFDEVIQADTVFYKLSWRETYRMQNKKGDKSIYSGFVEINE